MLILLLITSKMLSKRFLPPTNARMQEYLIQHLTPELETQQDLRTLHELAAAVPEPSERARALMHVAKRQCELSFDANESIHGSSGCCCPAHQQDTELTHGGIERSATELCGQSSPDWLERPLP